MKQYYTHEEVRYLVKCLLEARTRAEIIKNIERNREIGPINDGGKTPLERSGNDSPNLSAREHINRLGNTCAIMAAAHATGEHPIKILHRLIRDHGLHSTKNMSYELGAPTHPRVMHKVLKSLGYKLKPVSRETHGTYIHHPDDLRNPMNREEDDIEDHKEKAKIKKRRKSLFEKLHDTPKYPNKKPYKPDYAMDVAENVPHHKKYIAVTDRHTAVLPDTHVETTSGRSLLDMNTGHHINGMKHCFNIQHGEVHDAQGKFPSEYQVSHMYEVQKDHNHPRWRHESTRR